MLSCSPKVSYLKIKKKSIKKIRCSRFSNVNIICDMLLMITTDHNFVLWFVKTKI